ncbi:MAG: DUF2723 domain-containing protein [Bacteroidales bacterium]
MVRNYKLINNILGWIICIIASTVYVITAEPTVSFWDCGEYIATAYKLQVGHPPGAPTFQLIGRIFSMFAGDDVTKVAFCINTMSALCSGFTILFLFWSITIFTKKLALSKAGSVLTTSKSIAIFGSGIVGALAYTFTDTFWFSAVEGEVYAMSSFFTALVFWAILKWESVSDNNYSYRWIILIAFLIGLSIGVHLLNLLTLPAMVLVIYFKKYKPSNKGMIYALLLSFLIIGFIMWGLVPGLVKYSSVFERIFVNSFKLPFNVGTIFYFLAIAALLVWGFWYSEKRKKRLLNIILLSLTFIIIGYSTFLILVIRSNANTPIDENNPEDAVALLSYLNREQYGSNPLVYGEYYNSPVIRLKDGKPVYVKNYVVRHNDYVLKSFFHKKDAEDFMKENAGKYNNLTIRGEYVIGDPKKNDIAIYDGNYSTLFPRMWNKEGPRINQYKYWAGITEDYVMKNGQQVPRKPTFGENLKFFFKYQMGYMYGRYFMWNFVGRQTIDQGTGNQTKGEWLSGFSFIDEARLGPQNVPEHMKDNGRNTYFFLPLILGLIGLVFQFRKDFPNAFIILWLFIMTGIAIGVYLNMYAYQPRERDYAFAASFYAFAMWIGLGVYSIYEMIKKYMNKNVAATVTTIACLSVPTILAAQNWDDHNRSNRYLTREIAKAYLDSCAPNAILFTNGDNDTFPLWYLQEVEGYRTDIRICNLSLMGTDWYIDQMKRQAYNGLPVPMKMTKEIYQQGYRDMLFAYDVIKEPQDLGAVLNNIMYNPNNHTRFARINTASFFLHVDKEKVLANGTVAAKDSNLIVDRLVWRMPNESIYQVNGKDTTMAVSKAFIAMMDILYNNNWERPIYYVSTTTPDSYFGLEKYFQVEGMAYRLVPIDGSVNGRVNSDVLYDNIMNKFDFSEYANPNVFLSEDYTRAVQNIKVFMYRLSETLIQENDIERAQKVIERCYEWFPYNRIPYSVIDYYIGDTYMKCQTKETALKSLDIMNNYADQLNLETEYYLQFRGKYAQAVSYSLNVNRNVLNMIAYYTNQYRSFYPELEEKFKILEEKAKRYL